MPISFHSLHSKLLLCWEYSPSHSCRAIILISHLLWPLPFGSFWNYLFEFCLHPSPFFSINRLSFMRRRSFVLWLLWLFLGLVDWWRESHTMWPRLVSSLLCSLCQVFNPGSHPSLLMLIWHCVTPQFSSCYSVTFLHWPITHKSFQCSYLLSIF